MLNVPNISAGGVYQILLQPPVVDVSAGYFVLLLGYIIVSVRQKTAR